MDDLSDEQVATLIISLKKLQGNLQEALAAGADRRDIVDLDQSIGRLSRMDSLQQQKMAEAEQARRLIRLKQVKAALKWADEGEYGYCRRCGEPIDYRRLEARPESPCCVPCLRAVEG